MSKRGIKRIEAVNDFVVKFANVNGSGSASANELFAKAILRMGVPVSPRNIFPSNIQGLPTWYEVRVTERGWLGRRGGVDMMVAMNPQTFEADLREIEPGGYLFYDSTRPIPAETFRDDVTVVGMPVTAICNATYEDPRQRTLFKNIMVLGALAELMGVDAKVIEGLFSEQYKGKEKLLESNVRALHAGGSFATLSGVATVRLGRVDTATGQADGAWAPAPNGVVYALVANDGGLYVGGTFRSIAGASRAMLARVSLATPAAVDPGFSADGDARVWALAAVPGGASRRGDMEERRRLRDACAEHTSAPPPGLSAACAGGHAPRAIRRATTASRTRARPGRA